MPHTDLHDPDHPRARGVWSANASEALINDDDAHRPPRGATEAAPPAATTVRGLWGSLEQRSLALGRRAQRVTPGRIRSGNSHRAASFIGPGNRPPGEGPAVTPTSISRPPTSTRHRSRGVWTRRAPRDALLDTPAAHDTPQTREPRDDASAPRAGVWALPPSAGQLLAS